MTILGYGEDSLTYRVMHVRLQAFLAELNDGTPADKCCVYYRPSFGRRGGPTSPQFGEFDAILATHKFVYLVESKWDNAAKPASVVVLEEVQRLRHQIFNWLYERWQQIFGNTKQSNWEQFVQESSEDFSAAFPNRPLAPAGSLLARNLSHVLQHLAMRQRTMQNVLLYFHQQLHQPPGMIVTVTREQIDPREFRLVSLPYDVIDETGYIDMMQ